MIPSRRAFMMGAAALSAAVMTPDAVRAAAASRVPDWSLVTADIEVDIAPQSMRRIAGRAPAGLAGRLYRNGPAKFRRPGGNAAHWFDGAKELGNDSVYLDADTRSATLRLPATGKGAYRAVLSFGGTVLRQVELYEVTP